MAVDAPPPIYFYVSLYLILCTFFLLNGRTQSLGFTSSTKGQLLPFNRAPEKGLRNPVLTVAILHYVDGILYIALVGKVQIKAPFLSYAS